MNLQVKFTSLTRWYRVQLIKVIEECCELTDGAGENITEDKRQLNRVSDTLEDMLNGTFKKVYVQKVIEHIYNETVKLEIQAKEIEELNAKYLKDKNKLLEYIERQSESIQDIEVVR